jgi:membrane protease YdiL (CAAX protease family)
VAGAVSTPQDARRWPWAIGASAILGSLFWTFARADAIGVRGHGGDWLVVSGPVLTGPAAFGLAFVILGIAPALLARPLLGRPASTLGLGVGDWRRGLPLLGLGVVVGAVIGYRSAMSPDLAAVYPLGGTTLAPAAFTVHALGYLLYYAGFEYHYRGFLLLGLREHLGAGPANLLQAGLATLVHLGKPPVELAAVIPASLLFGWIALRTRSIWYAVAIHGVVGIALDYFLLAR